MYFVTQAKSENLLKGKEKSGWGNEYGWRDFLKSSRTVFSRGARLSICSKTTSTLVVFLWGNVTSVPFNEIFTISKHLQTSALSWCRKEVCQFSHQSCSHFCSNCALRLPQIIFANKSTGLEIMAEVCTVMTSKDVRQEEAKRFERLQWCRAMFIASNYVFIVKT